MTTPAGSAPAGWYTDPSNAQRNRWWDGTQWTENYSDPYSPATALKAPEGTRVYNLWIWLVVFVPYLTLPFLGAILPGIFAGFTASFNPTDPDLVTRGQLEMMTSPAFILLSLSGWVLGALVVLFAWLDWRWLKAAGVPKPFHWAWGFFGLAGYPVYAIGRAVVTRRRTGKGIAVMWVVIAIIVLTFIFTISWVGFLVAGMMAQMPTYY